MSFIIKIYKRANFRIIITTLKEIQKLNGVRSEESMRVGLSRRTRVKGYDAGLADLKQQVLYRFQRSQ